MPDLSSIRRRITSVKSTQKIATAMKMVSTAKLWKYEEKLKKLKIYFEEILNILHYIQPVSSNNKPKSNKICIVVLGSDRGLCGSYNNKILTSFREKHSKLNYEGEIELIGVGSKIISVFSKHYKFNKTYENVWNKFSDNLSSEIFNPLSKSWENGEIDEIHIMYNSFKTVMCQVPELLQVLPLKERATDEKLWTYEFEPESKMIFNKLYPIYMDTLFYYIMMEAMVSEHGSRMVAMDAASKNGNDLLKKLKLEYNKIRQTLITLELTEIVAGTEALK
jgi:F-type H+-transporting ATPase subunit gamma